ncbi:hydrolase protein [Rutstroemia sp. NJR-2017a BBW]|nr:hydrolase protein [Rutstroemia sp. NJR-2017a BBW]
MTDIQLKTVKTDGIEIFYRESGPAAASTILLLHGYPSSSHQYRNLIPLLSKKYHVVAPDLPGFGFTKVPEERNYTYTFDALSRSIESFLNTLSVTTYSVYIFDYGAPVALRLALRQPKTVTAIISQNGNAYTEGLGDFWAPLQNLWTLTDPAVISTARTTIASAILTLDATKRQYTFGAPHPELIAPEAWALDYALLTRPGQEAIQLDLFADYKNNVELYPEFQKFFRESNVPILAVWGKNDEIFVPPGAEAFKSDAKNSEVVFVDAGHFALETNTKEIAEIMLRFLEKNGI